MNLTSTKLNELNIIQLYKHYAALEHSMPMLTPASQEVAAAELETCAALRSEKIDRIHYAIASHEDTVERIKKEQDLMVTAKKHSESQIQQLKNLLSYLRRSLPADSNKITGRNYQFTLVKKKELSVYVSSNPEDWSANQRQRYCLEEEVRTTKHVVVRTLAGELISESHTPKVSTKVQPNLDAIREAHRDGLDLPLGSKFGKSTQSERRESMENNWIHKHPLIPESFLMKIDAPVSVGDAHVKRTCHEQSVQDFNLQIEIINHEMAMLEDMDGSVCEYNEDNYGDLESRKLKLLISRRFHQNAANAYWYSEYLSTFGSN